MEEQGEVDVDRVEVLAGPAGRRRWPDEVKCQLVAESMVPGVSVGEVAQRYGLLANHFDLPPFSGPLISRICSLYVCHYSAA